MFEFITLSTCDKWDFIVKSFDNYDIYYLSGYVKAFQIHGDGEPVLFYYKADVLRGFCVMMKRDIAKTPEFAGILEEKEYYDLITPYGYGGFIFDRVVCEPTIKLFNEELKDLLNKSHVVSAFFRFHPMLHNADAMRGTMPVIDLGKTISMDTSDFNLIWSNITSKNRNMIRKAEKSGVVIKHGKGLSFLKQFVEIYNATMDYDNAEDYYYFKTAFYESIDRDLQDNYEVFYAEYDGKPIAMSIMLFANGMLSYHLSGSKIEFRNLAPSNLLLYKTAVWGCEQGLKTFHLGGGVGSSEDSLYKFKEAFNRNSDNRFSIGKYIVDNAIYNQLIDIRKKSQSFDCDSNFFPLYRA